MRGFCLAWSTCMRTWRWPARQATRRPPAERVVASAREHLAAGVLAIREPGSVDYSSTRIGPAGGLPRTITAGRYFPGLAREVADDQLPDAAVEELAAGGGAWAKVIGDTPLGADRLTRTFSDDALAEAAGRVHAAGGRIAIHCSIPEVIQAAIDAGFDSLEHASFLQPDQLAAAASGDVAWVPTLSIEDGIRAMVAELGFSAAGISQVEDGLARQPEVLRQAAAAGVRVLAGTDAGVGPHGMIRGEVQRLRGAGLTAEVALGAASWTARSWLGLPHIEDARRPTSSPTAMTHARTRRCSPIRPSSSSTVTSSRIIADRSPRAGGPSGGRATGTASEARRWARTARRYARSAADPVVRRTWSASCCRL
jgi:hypothetical protein